MKHKRTVLPFLIFALFLGGIVSARAVQATTEPANRKVQVREEFQEMKEKLASAKCARVEKQVKNRIDRFDNQSLLHIASYEKTKTLLVGKIAKIKSKGYDVKTLEADLVEYDKLIVQFKADYESYKVSLGELKSFACGDTEGVLRTQLADSRAKLKLVHQDAVAIRTFWAKTMRLHYLALKEQKLAGQEDETDSPPNTNDDTTNGTTNESGE